MDRGRGAAHPTPAALDRRVEVVGVGRVDRQARGRDPGEEVARDLGPRVAAVGGLQDAVAEVAVAGQGAFARAGVNHEIIGRGHGERADGEGRQLVGFRLPEAGRRVEKPDAALGRAQDPLAVLPDGQRADPAAPRLQRARAPGNLERGVRAEPGPGAREAGACGRRRDTLGRLGCVAAELAGLRDRKRAVAGGARVDEGGVSREQLLQVFIFGRDWLDAVT